MKTWIIIRYFTDVLSCEPEKIEVLNALLAIYEDKKWLQGVEEALIDFIEYYGFDVELLEQQIEDWCQENWVIY